MANLAGALQKGRNLRIYVGETLATAKPIAGAESCKLSWSTSFDSISHKDTDEGATDQTPTTSKWNMSTKLYMTINPDTLRYAYKEIIKSAVLLTKVFVKFDDAMVGGLKYTGEAYVGKWDIDSSNQKTPMLSVDFEGTGTLTILDNTI